MAFTDRNAAYDLSLFEQEELYELEGAFSQNKILDIKEESKKHIQSKPKTDPLTYLLCASVSVLVIIAVSAIIHGQVQLTELNQQISNSSTELTELQSYYTQIEMKVENKLGPSVVEEYAKNELGMNKTESYQKEFISLSDGDKAEVLAENDKSILDSIVERLKEKWASGEK